MPSQDSRSIEAFFCRRKAARENDERIESGLARIEYVAVAQGCLVRWRAVAVRWGPWFRSDIGDAALERVAKFVAVSGVAAPVKA